MVKYLYGTSVVFHDDYHVCSGICRQKCFTNINKRSGLMSPRPRVTTTCVTGKRSHKESCFLFVVIQPFWGRVGKFLSADLQFSVLVGDNYFSFDVVFFPFILFSCAYRTFQGCVATYPSKRDDLTSEEK